MVIEGLKIKIWVCEKPFVYCHSKHIMVLMACKENDMKKITSTKIKIHPRAIEAMGWVLIFLFAKDMCV